MGYKLRSEKILIKERAGKFYSRIAFFLGVRDSLRLIGSFTKPGLCGRLVCGFVNVPNAGWLPGRWLWGSESCLSALAKINYTDQLPDFAFSQ